MAETYIPLISSGTAGPLGVLHLPRLWQKVSLEARGKLAAGYPSIGKGYDMMTCNALGLNPDAVKQFIAQNKPTYPQFEAWVKKQPGVKLDKATLYKHNSSIRGYIHDDVTRKGILGASGISDEGSVNPGAVDLNNLDDWYEFHQAVLRDDAPRPAADAPVAEASAAPAQPAAEVAASADQPTETATAGAAA